MKLRETTWTPAWCNAPAIVCPGRAVIDFPSNVNWQDSSWLLITGPAFGCPDNRRTWQDRVQHLVGSGVTLDQEPLSAGPTVEPPFPLNRSSIRLVVGVGDPLVGCCPRLGSLLDWTTEVKFSDRPPLAMRTWNHQRHAVSPSLFAAERTQPLVRPCVTRSGTRPRTGSDTDRTPTM